MAQMIDKFLKGCFGFPVWGTGLEEVCSRYTLLCGRFRVSITLGLQIAQSRSYLYTLRPKVGIICILGALGLVSIMKGFLWALVLGPFLILVWSVPRATIL